MTMKKMTRQLLAAAVALTAITSCSDSNYLEAVTGEPAVNDRAMNTAVLTDANGQQVARVAAGFGTYYLDIKTDGMWYVEPSDNMELTPARTFGRGSMRVPVMIGNNWADARQLTYTVRFIGDEGQSRRAPASGEDSQTVTQEGADLAKFKEIVNSNIFVGYGYNPTKNDVPELCTGIQIFKMD